MNNLRPRDISNDFLNILSSILQLKAKLEQESNDSFIIIPCFLLNLTRLLLIIYVYTYVCVNIDTHTHIFMLFLS